MASEPLQKVFRSSKAQPPPKKASMQTRPRHRSPSWKTRPPPKNSYGPLKKRATNKQPKTPEAKQPSKRQAARQHAEEQATLENAPRSPWSPRVSELVPLVPRDQLPVWLEAVADLDRYNMLQPNQATANREGVQARLRQWQQLAGGREGKPSFVLLVIGAAVGLVVGGILGIGIPPDTLGGVPPFALTALLGCPGGAFVAYLLVSQDSYGQAMMRVIVNERRSVITPERVTGMVWIWVPKAVLNFRAHDWRYADGKPYLWVHLPIGERIHDRVRGTLSYIDLPNDLYRALNAAVYAQRTRNRDISNNATDFADVDEGEEAATCNEVMERLLPYVPVPIMMIGGVLLVIMTG